MKSFIEQTKNNELIVTFLGAMDSQGMGCSQDDIEQLAQTSVASVILDLHEVDRIDSSGIGAIVFLFKRLKLNNRSLALVGIHGQPKQLIKMLRLHYAMPVEWLNEEQANVAMPEAVNS
ncbi:STAS domain-containing protein [Psychrobium sp. 1_MG-2023]|uniref:STAS domain-containing protein n=1 Tax=Psychrobium sp. 1_MG-2023 TaxID=3062624 RepID=UPI0026B47D06|nr:STAS domain-containing protein [Psychrobium sp. 1_MG-2023]MDP2561335.1 STAS domain-containing protein [Psychrobium sp. 1_MG-2023]